MAIDPEISKVLSISESRWSETVNGCCNWSNWVLSISESRWSETVYFLIMESLGMMANG